MMKILLSVILLFMALFVFSGCKGRAMPLHPSQPRPLTLKDINLTKLSSKLSLGKKSEKNKDLSLSEKKIKISKEESTDMKESNLSKITIELPKESKEENRSKIIKETPKKPEKITLSKTTEKTTVKPNDINVSNVIINKKSDIEKRKLPKPTLSGSANEKKSALSTKLYSTVKSTKDIPILKDIGKLKNISVKEIPFLRSISSLTKYLPQGPGNRTRRIHKGKIKHKYQASNDNGKSFTGGMISGNLDIGRVDLGENGQYLRLIFNSYKYVKGSLPTELADHSGVYRFTYDAQNHRIIAKIDGYKAISGLLGDQSELYRGNSIVKTIHVGDPTDDESIHFVIELKQDAKINVFELHKPARIIVDIVPMYRLFGEAS